MKKKQFILLCFILFSLKLNAQYGAVAPNLTPTWEWGVDFNGNIISSLVHDNYIYTFGNYSDSSIHLGTFSLSNAGGTDSYIAKWDTLGNVIWAVSISDTSSQSAIRLHINTNNELVAVGNNKSPSLMIGIDSVPSGISNGIYTTTIDLNGNILDAFSIPSTSDSDFCIDNANNLYYATNLGLFKYSSVGIQLWHKPQIIVDKISYSALGNCLLGIGNFDNTLTIESSSITEYTVTGLDAKDLFAVRLNLNGGLIWLHQKTFSSKRDEIISTFMDKSNGQLYFSTDNGGSGINHQRLWKIDSSSYLNGHFYQEDNAGQAYFSQIGVKDSFITFLKTAEYASLQMMKWPYSPPHIYNYNCTGNHLIFEGPNSIYISGRAGTITHSFGKLGYTLLASSYVPTTTACVGSSVKFKSNIIGGGLPYSYSWAPTTGLIITNADSIEFIATSSITYSLTVTDIHGQVITKTYDLIVDTPITSVIVPDFPTFCHDSMILSAVPPIEGYWYKFGGGTSWSPVYPHSYDSFTVINSTGLYRFSKGNTCGYIIDSIQIDPTSPVTANSTLSGFCQGQSVTLSGGGANSYSWSNGVLDNISFIPFATQTYVVTGIDTNGCSDTASIQIIVYPPTSSIINVSICQVSLPYVWNSQVIYSSGIYTTTFLNSHGCDSISNLNLSIHTSSSNNIILNICSSDLPYMWNSQVLNNTGNYSELLTNAWGCDSVVTLDLTVTPSSIGTENTTICSTALPFVWNALSLTSSGSYSANFTNALGCDSIATLNLVVNSTSTSITDTTICSTALPFVWNTLSFNSSGNYTTNFINALGCDSVAALNLIVNATSTSTTDTTICSTVLPFVWNTLSFNSSGNYTANFTNALGCDSVAALNLIVNSTSTSTTDTTICSTDLPFVWNTLSLTSSGNYSANFTNALGCDSVAALNLIVNSTSTSTTDTTICSSALPYVWNSQTLTSSGLYTSSLTNYFGCDSIASLNLVVNPNPQPTIIQNNYTLICTNASNVNYQWFFNGTSIGNNDSVLTITQDGQYVVMITDSAGCIGYDTLTIIGLSVDEIDADNIISIYPNPTTGQLTIEFNLDESCILSLKLLDVQGRTLSTIMENKRLVSGNYHQAINLKSLGLTSGIYLLSGHSANHHWIKRIVYFE
ncbi:MAG TPA: T9SS type A sorting domain-containing protein [Chitinophagaceae bacterium]|nr:T9SS type A sorting domain-containing protein [Chitinophagaceae bacterium]